MSDFPLIRAAIRNTDRFDRHMAFVREAEAAGSILNPVYKDCKDMLNRLLEEAWKNTICEPFVYAGKWEDLPGEVYAFYNTFNSYPSMHTIPGMRVKVTKTKLTHPMIDAMRALLDEAAPLAATFATLKTQIVKRQPKPVEDRKAKYSAPEVDLTAIGVVKTLLEQITEDARIDLIATLSRSIQAKLNAYLTAQAKARAEGKILTLENFYYDSRSNRTYSPSSYHLVSQLVNQYSGFAYDREVTVRDDAAEIMIRIATEDADAIREMFVYKNLTKIDSILDAKGNFASAQVLGREIEMGALRGTLRFAFTDGSGFTVINNVVWSHSVYGKPFQRFPLTFHDVVLADGTTMPRPSEQRMNTVFLGR